MKKFHKYLSNTLALILIVFYQFIIPVRAGFAAAPTPPPAPTAPTPEPAPSAPTAPTPPPAPTLEDNQDNDNQDEEEHEEDEEEQDEEASQQQSNSSSSETPTSNESSNGSSGASSGNQVGDSTVNTGDATANVQAATDVNQNSLAAPTSSVGGVEATTAGNGSESNNNNTVSLSSDALTVQNNDAKLGNNVEAGTNTGSNDNSKNVGNSTTITGDANTSATIITTANTNANGIIANEFNVVDDYIGDIVLDVTNPCQAGCEAGEVVVLNKDNGADSTNSNDVSVATTDQTFQNNSADLDNNILLSADSGNNTSKDNTGGDTSIQTGDANVVANVASFLNNNIAGEVVLNTVNIFGDLVGDIIAPEMAGSSGCSNCSGSNAVAASNTGNGAYSDNSNSFSSADESLVVQDNDATINNAIAVDTNTGGNSSSANTGGNSTVETGESTVDVNVLNVANQNVSGDWWIVLVNEAGNWVGKILGAPDGANMAGSEGTEFQVGADGTITASNSGNGAGSTNTNNVDQSNSSTVVQTNTANVNNNLQLSANTGNNDASRNTGGDSSVSTGDANIMANLVNFINNNITGGGRVHVTVINVFGSWLGDFVSPGTTQTADASSQQSQQESNTQAIGGLSATPTPTPKTTISSVEEEETESTEEVSFRRRLLARTTSNSVQGKTTLNAHSKVLGESDELVDLTSGSSNSEDTAQYETGQEEATKIKITWPTIITSVLGLLYAAVKARGFFA